MKILCVFGRNAYGDAARGEGYEHANFLPALRALGHETVLFESFDRMPYRDFADMNRSFILTLKAERPDAVLCVLMGYELWTQTLDLARALCHGPIINWGTDDSWKYAQFTRYIAQHVDCYATTSASALERARRAGRTNVVLTQWAAADTLLVMRVNALETAPSLAAALDDASRAARRGDRAAITLAWQRVRRALGPAPARGDALGLWGGVP